MSDSRKWDGRLFHTRGPATEKLLPLYGSCCVCVCVDRCVSWWKTSDAGNNCLQRGRHRQPSTAWLDSDWWTGHASLKVTHCWTGSQCNWCSTGVTWSWRNALFQWWGMLRHCAPSDLNPQRTCGQHRLSVILHNQPKYASQYVGKSYCSISFNKTLGSTVHYKLKSFHHMTTQNDYSIQRSFFIGSGISTISKYATRNKSTTFFEQYQRATKTDKCSMWISYLPRCKLIVMFLALFACRPL